MRRYPLPALLLILALPGVAFAHGGAWRGPRGPRTPGDPIPSGGAGPSTWQTTWVLNRERILDLRALQNERLRARTPKRSARFFGGSYGPDRPDPAAQEAWDAILAALMQAARDENRDVATGAIIALGKAGDPRARALLRELAVDEHADRTVPESAALALGMIGGAGRADRKLLEGLVADAKRQRRFRAFAAMGLGFLGDIGALPALMAFARAKEVNRDVPSCSIIGLGLLGDEMVVPNLARGVSGPPPYRVKDDLLRAWYVHAIGMIRSRAGLPAVLAALDDEHVEVRRQAALSAAVLARAEDVEAVSRLVHLMRTDRDHLVQSFAAFSLGEIGAASAADHLLLAYRKGQPTLVPHAALALALLARNAADPGLREKIVPLLRRELAAANSLDLRGALAICVGIVGDRESVKPLLRILEKKGAAQLRAHAAVALGLIGADEALPALRAALRERASPMLQREAAIALGLFGDRDAVDILLDLVKNGSTEYVRGSAATSLGRLADPKTALVLREILVGRKNPDTTRAFVAVALGMVVDRRDYPILSRIGDHLNHAMVGDAVMEVLSLL